MTRRTYKLGSGIAAALAFATMCAPIATADQRIPAIDSPQAIKGTLVAKKSFAIKRGGSLPAACYIEGRATRVTKIPSTGCDDFTVFDVRSCGDLNSGATLDSITSAARAKQLCPAFYDPNPKGAPYFGSIQGCKATGVSYGTSITTPDPSRPNVKMASVDVYCTYAPGDVLTEYEDPELRPTGAGALRTLILKGAKLAFFFRR